MDILNWAFKLHNGSLPVTDPYLMASLSLREGREMFGLHRWDTQTYHNLYISQNEADWSLLREGLDLSA